MLGNDETSKAVISVIAKLHFMKIYIYPTFHKSFNILCSVLLVSLQERKVNLNCTGHHKHSTQASLWLKCTLNKVMLHIQ